MNCFRYGYLLAGYLGISLANAQGFKIEKIDRATRIPSSAVTAATAQSLEKDSVYWVVKGDVLTRIAERMTGSSSNWRAIAEYNQLDSEHNLYQGLKLLIPPHLQRQDIPAQAKVMTSSKSSSKSVENHTPQALTSVATISGFQASTENVDMFVGEIHVYNKVPINRVEVGNDNVVKARVLESDELLVIAESEGSTSLRLWHVDGSQTDYNIRVSSHDPETRFRKEKMVNLRVKMVEFRKSTLNRLGINWGDSAAGPTFAAAGDVISNPLFRPQQDELGSTLPNSVEPFSGYFGITSSLSSRINALAASGDAQLLAEPVLSCANGESARFLAGGEVPYPTIGSNGQTSIDFKEYGIKLEVSPRIDTKGNVQTHVLAEISSIDPAVSVQGAPGLLTRRTQTQVNVKSGQTIVISGLLKSEDSQESDKVPGLSRLPLIGKLFGTRTVRSGVSELVIFITPEIVDDAAESITEHQRKIEVFSARRLSDSAQRILGEALK